MGKILVMTLHRNTSQGLCTWVINCLMIETAALAVSWSTFVDTWQDGRALQWAT